MRYPALKKPRYLLHRIVVAWSIQIAALFIVVVFYSGLQVDTFLALVVFAAVLGLLNALIWPIVSYYMFPITIFTIGIANLVLNGIIIMLASYFVEGIYITSLGAAIWIAILLTAANTILSAIFSIDDDQAYYNNVLKRRAAKTKIPASDKPGIIFLEIDGLSDPVFRKALQKGYMPTLKRWIQDTHTLKEWETDLSSQTGASQAGLLLGSNENMPAFRWVEKDRGNKIITTSGPFDAPEIEADHSTGEGLLALHGASRTNMFSGDADDTIFTFSKLSSIDNVYNKALYGFFSSPYNFSRVLVLIVWDIILEFRSRIHQKRNNVIPRLGRDHRGGTYPLMRAFTTVIIRDMTTYTLIGDIYAGQKNAIYATYMAYDEVAHHSGVEDDDALKVLHNLDKQFARIEQAAKEALRKYHLVVLSDHGQTEGETFKQRYGITLEDLVREKVVEDLTIKSKLNTDEDWGHMNMMLTGAIKDKESKMSRLIRQMLKSKTKDGNVALGPDAKDDIQAEGEEQLDIIVLASGNLGLIYFSHRPERISYEQLEKDFPSIVEQIANHEGVGFVMVKSEKHGGIVIGTEGKNYINEDRVEGKDPLKGFGDNAKRHVKRTNSFKYCPDILVNSFYDDETKQGAAFEELIGFHGGLGGYQTQPFILYPKDWNYPNEKVIGAENLHTIIKGWVSKTHN